MMEKINEMWDWLIESRKMNEVNSMWDWLIELGIATEEELKLITGINGYNMDVLNDVLYYRTGYRDREQVEG